MRYFHHGQRVKVLNSENPEMVGRIGTVHRIKMSCPEAWIRFEDPLPKGLASFPPEDERGKDCCFWPEDCEESR